MEHRRASTPATRRRSTRSSNAGCARRSPPAGCGPAISCRPSASSRSSCSVNANTVARVYAELERAGVIETRRGVGSFVSATPAQAHPPRERDAGCARSSRACWPTPTPAASPSTISSTALERQARTMESARRRTQAMAPVIFAGSDGPAVNVPARQRRGASRSSLAAVAVGAFGWQQTGSLLAAGADDHRVGLVLMQAPRVAQQWERAVVLRLGRFVGLRGPGLFWVVPFVDRVSALDRSADDHDQLRRRADADGRHGAGQRRRGAVLDGARRREGRARSAGLRAGGELGGADRAARHHRPHDARPICCAGASRSRTSCSS